MLFPTLRGKKFCGPVNLDKHYRRWAREHYYTCPNPSPALLPHIAQNIVDTMHRNMGVDWSWGGLYENRATLWRGGYMANERKWVHLGVDLNVPAGTTVHADSPGEVLRIDHDTSEGGWGTRLILKLFYHPIVLIYAHLSPNLEFAYQTTTAGMTLSQGQELGRLGGPQENGGWFPHLHLQAMSETAAEYYLTGNRLEQLDGYGKAEEMEQHLLFHPDPLPYVRLS